jgi:hypothetical protein
MCLKDLNRVSHYTKHFGKFWRNSSRKLQLEPTVVWNIPAERGRGPSEADRTVREGSGIHSQRQDRSEGLLELFWGEPELLMSLAWSNLGLVGAEIKAVIESTEGKRLRVSFGNETDSFFDPLDDLSAKCEYPTLV